MFRKVLCAAAVVLLVAALPEFAEACPNCKEGMQNNGNGAAMIRGYFFSILFMMSMPFLILGTFSAYMYHEVRKAREARALAEKGKTPEVVA